MLPVRTKLYLKVNKICFFTQFWVSFILPWGPGGMTVEKDNDGGADEK